LYQHYNLATHGSKSPNFPEIRNLRLEIRAGKSHISPFSEAIFSRSA